MRRIDVFEVENPMVEGIRAMQQEWSAKFFGDREDPRRRLEAMGFGPPPGSGRERWWASLRGQPSPADATPQPDGLQWAAGVLDGAGIDLASARRWSNARAEGAAALRKADPRMTAKAAMYLIRNLGQ